MPIRFQILTLAVVALTGCVSYPLVFENGESSLSPRVAIASASSGEAYLSAGVARFAIQPAVETGKSPQVVFAPIAPHSQTELPHFGAFYVLHGDCSRMISVYWWAISGHLRSAEYLAACASSSSIRWISDRILRIQYGNSLKIVRLNEDDGPETTEF